MSKPQSRVARCSGAGGTWGSLSDWVVHLNFFGWFGHTPKLQVFDSWVCYCFLGNPRMDLRTGGNPRMDLRTYLIGKYVTGYRCDGATEDGGNMARTPRGQEQVFHISYSRIRFWYIPAYTFQGYAGISYSRIRFWYIPQTNPHTTCLSYAEHSIQLLAWRSGRGDWVKALDPKLHSLDPMMHDCLRP